VSVSHLAADSDFSMIRHMPVIETISTVETAAALGLKPATVRLHIKSGDLAAVRIGRSWRIGVDSVNALLAGANLKSEVVTSAPVVTSQPAAVSVQSIQPQAKASVPAFDASDLRYIAGYRAELLHSNPAIVENAKYQLSMFEKRAASLVRMGAAPVSMEESTPSTMVLF